MPFGDEPFLFGDRFVRKMMGEGFKFIFGDGCLGNDASEKSFCGYVYISLQGRALTLRRYVNIWFISSRLPRASRHLVRISNSAEVLPGR